MENTTSINSTRITAFERVDDNLWIAAWGVGLNKMNLKTREFTNYKMSDEKNKGRKNFIIDLKKDSKGRLWALNQNLHISCFDTRTGNFININTDEIDFENVVVTRSLEDKEGNIWIGTLRDGLFQIKFDNKHLSTVTNYKYDPFDAHSISSNTITSLMQDNSGNIWVGTSGGGINKFNTRKPKFNLINNNKDISPHLIGRKVTSFAEDNSGNVWIGTADEGLYKFNIKENKIESINHDGGKYKNISALYFDGKENLYIGLYYKGVYKYNLSKKTYSGIDFKNHINTILLNAVSVITGIRIIIFG